MTALIALIAFAAWVVCSVPLGVLLAAAFAAVERPEISARPGVLATRAGGQGVRSTTTTK